MEGCIQGFPHYLANKPVKCTREQKFSWGHYALAVVKTTPVGTESVGHIPRCILGLKYCIMPCINSL